jgi:hypothetical protein
MQSTPDNSLPQSHILSYVGNISTPTHVRRFTANALRAIAALHILAALITFLYLAVTGTQSFNAIHFAPRFGVPRPTFLETFFQVIELNTGLVALLIFLCLMAISLFACAAPVARAKHAACIIAGILIVPYLLITAVGSLTLPLSGLQNGLGLYQSRPYPIYLWQVPLGLLSIIAALSLRDLLGMLTWIADRPQTEKHPEPFLPKSLRTNKAAS